MGFEPTTRGLKGRCSNLLSYGPALLRKQNNSLHYPDFCQKVNRGYLLVLLAVFMVFGALQPQKEQAQQCAATNNELLGAVDLLPER